MITLTCIVEDRDNPPFRHEHGIAFWIETPDGRVLFDTGGSGEVLLHNLHRLDLDPATLDAIALSHAHNDHTGGLPALLPLLRPDIPLYANPTLFRRRYSDHGHGPEDVGPSLTAKQLEGRVALRLNAEPQEILPGLWTTGEITARPHPEGRSARHTVIENERHVPDPYQDDLSLVLETPEGFFLLCGCCHAGLLNTLAHVRKHWDGPIVGLGGGTHLTGASSAVLHETVAAVKSLETVEHVWLGHCSGKTFMAEMAAAMGSRFHRCLAGSQIRL